MKVNRTYSLDYEILEKLKGINASELISKLLTEYFDKKDDFINKMSREELDTFIKLEESKLEAEKKIEVLKNGTN